MPKVVVERSRKNDADAEKAWRGSGVKGKDRNLGGSFEEAGGGMVVVKIY